MVGTLRVNAARLVSPGAYWVFTGDDFDLKISDKDHPSYLVIANDPEKEQVIGSLNALVLNRFITRVNSKGNIPVSIIVDELPTLYFHKIDRLIGTARSNKVAVTLGFQELPQLEADYGKVGMQKISLPAVNFMERHVTRNLGVGAERCVRQDEADLTLNLHQ
jgi:type IV secretory pathway TraG/TraD family ATPase VirD4